MKLSILAAATSLVLQSTASVVGERAVAGNNCGRAVAGTAKGTAFQAQATADCIENVQSTTSSVLVTPSPVTAIGTVTLLATVFPTTTSTASLLSTDLSTLTETSLSSVVSTSTVTTVQTSIITQTPLVTSFSTLTFTSTGSPTTVTIYSPTAAFRKREIEQRETTTQAASSASVPSYASVCKGFSEYSAACGLLAISGTTTVTSTLPVSTVSLTVSTLSTTTLSADTSYITETSIATVIVSTTQIATTTIESDVTVSQTSFSTATAAAQATVQFVSTTVTLVASTMTSTIPIPTFKVALVPISGTATVAGAPTKYFSTYTQEGTSLPATDNIDNASLFTIDTHNRLVEVAGAGRSVNFELITNKDYYVGFVSETFLNQRPTYRSWFAPLNCTVDMSLLLHCSYGQYNKWSLYNSIQQWFITRPSYVYSGFTDYQPMIIPVS